MSLNDTQRATTRGELAANLRIAGTTPADLAAALDLPIREVHAALDVSDGADPAVVWAVRDRIERLVAERGGTPEPYTHLSEGMRASARRWFGVGDER